MIETLPVRPRRNQPTNRKMKTTQKATLIETQATVRDYGFTGTLAIVDTADHGRILIEDGFGGMDSIEGGCVRWKHGSAYQLQPGDTFASLGQNGLAAVIQQCDESRPYLQWSGHVVASVAKSLGL
jgi:hypothetical protein